ncbi:hypothetical protein D1159_12240 [Pseudoflavonifractor sp. 524-17]|uniref:hypothetical protein n=1 Tax=Pseudoflavonifractor sp. 524-17 TaxID=2304577 RepID=UPI00137AEA12|nr:hypothetical protein [Pseudoflavonifractor sp. 524-17]NCE65325.1 hypothetical protein [Pseudoflavonifractor sp. 524-17]
MARIRTLPKAAEEIKANDTNTVITYQRLRRWVLDGKIKRFDGGKCRLVDLDEVERMVSGAAYADR